MHKNSILPRSLHLYALTFIKAFKLSSDNVNLNSFIHKVKTCIKNLSVRSLNIHIFLLNLSFKCIKYFKAIHTIVGKRLRDNSLFITFSIENEQQYMRLKKNYNDL